MTSVIIITSNQNQKLNLLIDSLSKGSVTPREAVIMDLAGNAHIDKEYNFMIKMHHYKCESGVKSYQAARNRGADKAWEENLIFIDVNCIPNPKLIEKMEEHLLCSSGLIMAEPRYLNNSFKALNEGKDLFEHSSYHRNRPELNQELNLCFQPDLFWGICFGIRRCDFEKAGRFDELYHDRSVADIDFALAASKQKVDFYLARNTVFHWPDTSNSRLNGSLENFIRNVNYFYSKWSQWPMKEQLKEMEEQSLIDWNENQKVEIKLRNQSQRKVL